MAEYSNYTNLSTNLSTYSTYALIVQNGTYAFDTIGAWIDYNNDNDFNDAGEKLDQLITANANTNYTINFTVAGNTPIGAKRLRVRIAYNSGGIANMDPCTNYGYGETEDYSVNIIAGTPLIPVANFTGSALNITAGQSINFTDLSTNTPTSWSWTFTGAAPSSSTAQNPAGITYNNPGCYQVALTATNSAGNNTLTQTCYINVTAAPVPCSEIFFSEYLEGLANDKALEIYNPSASSISLSNYSIEMYANGAVIPTASISLTATLQANDVYVIANSAASAAILAIADYASAGICNFNGNDALVLKKNGVVIDVIGVVGVNPGTAWTVGTGSTLDNTLVRNATVSGPTNLWSTSQSQWTSYPVGTTTYLGSNTNNCANPVVAPVANFTANTFTITAGQSVNFTDLSTNTPTTWSWTFTGAATTTSSLQNPQNIVYNNPGCYQVSLTATNSAGSNTKTMTCYITVNPLVIAPVADFTANTLTIIAGQSVSFTDLSANSPTSWSWAFQGANTTSSTLQNPSNIVYNNPGCYQVSLTVTNSAGSNTSTQTCYITVTNPVIVPVANFTASSFSIITGQSVNFTDISTNNPTSWNWVFTGGTPASSTSQNPTNITYNTPGCYQVSLTATNSAGSNTSTQTCYVTVTNPIITPVANFTANTQFITVGQSVNFTDLSANTPTSWSWAFTGAATASSTSQNPQNIVYNNVGCYQVSLTATNSVGSNTSTQTCYINVTQAGVQPQAVFSMSTDTACVNSSVNMINTSSNALSFVWTFNGGNPATSNAQNPNVSYNNAGSYDITLIAINGTNSDTLTQSITINPTPTVSAGADVGICFGSGVFLNATAVGNVTYNWTPAATLTTPTLSQTLATPIANTDYVVTVNDGLCSASDTITVTVWPLPTAPTITQAGNNLEATSGFAGYQWYLNTNLISGADTSVLTPLSSGDYSVDAIDTNGCISSSQLFNYVMVGLETVGESNWSIYPNPTASVINIDIQALNNKKQIEITNLQGQILLSETISKTHSTFDIQNLASGVYFVRVGSRVQKLIKE